MSGTLPTNGITFPTLLPTNKVTQAAKPGATGISVPPTSNPLLFFPTSGTGVIKPKPAVVDSKLGVGRAVTQGEAAINLFGLNYFTAKMAAPNVAKLPPALASAVLFASGAPPTTVTDKLVLAEKDTFTQQAPPNEYLFNLSPHSWSLPLAPKTVDNRTFRKSNPRPGATKANVVGTNPNNAASVKGKLRRGRITWHASAQDLQYATSSGGSAGVVGGKARQIGFQFLWNPESFSTQVILNSDVTPSMQDRFVGVAGAFPGTETISLTIRIDRTNDFACFAHKGTREKDPTSKVGGDREKQWGVNFGKFYKGHKLGLATDALIAKQIAEVYEMGTLADIEFLYQTINGPNANYMKGGWKNSLGRVTSDIGFLSATLVKFEIGPVNYLGYINGLSVNHLAFTQDMKPIRSDVSIQANLLASVGLAEAGQ
jgi:hypothetical protein